MTLTHSIIRAMQIIISESSTTPHLVYGKRWLVAASPRVALAVRGVVAQPGVGVITGATLARLARFAGRAGITRIDAEPYVVVAHSDAGVLKIQHLADVEPQRPAADYVKLLDDATFVSQVNDLPDAERLVLDGGAFRAKAEGVDEVSYDAELLHIAMSALQTLSRQIDVYRREDETIILATPGKRAFVALAAYQSRPD